MYTWNQLGINEITNLFLYGTLTPPPNLESESIIRGNDVTVQIVVDAVSFMATGPGRFANGPQVAVVDQFMSGKLAKTNGVRQEYTLTEALALLGDPKGDRFSYLASNFTDGQDDHAMRTYIWQTESFKLSEKVRFVIEADGTRYIENYAIRPFDDNFDFKSDTGLSAFGNGFLEPRIDPWRIGRTVNIVFDPASKDAIPSFTYTTANYYADVQRYSDTYNPISGTARLAYEMPGVVNDLWTSHTTQFIDSSGRVIVFGSSNSDTLGESSIRDLPIDSPLRIYHVMSSRGVVLIGGSGNDTLTGGAGADKLYGGADDDILHGDDGAGGDVLEGGAGLDTYYADDDDTIRDSDGKGGVYLNGKQLTFATRKKGEAVWKDSAGNTYALNGGKLEINDPLVIEGDDNGELGIYLDEEEDPDDRPSPSIPSSASPCLLHRNTFSNTCGI